MIGAATVTTAVPVLPSLVAVIVAEPVATAVSRPLVLTVATAGALLVHVTERPVNTFPLASLSVAVSCCVAPGFWLTVAGLSDTDATGAITVTFATPLTPSLVAVIVAEPVVTAVSRPLLLTVATTPLLEAHATARPDSTFPLASFRVAVNCCVPPGFWLTVAGLSDTDATGAITVTFATPLTPSLVAVIVAEPVVTAVSRPLLLTVATVGVLLVQVTERPVTTFPVASLSVAVNCCVPPIIWLTLPGVTVTDATGAGTVLATRSVAIVRLSTHIV